MSEAASGLRRGPLVLRTGGIALAAGFALIAAACTGVPAGAQTRDPAPSAAAPGGADTGRSPARPAPAAPAQPAPRDPAMIDAREAYSRAVADKSDIRFGLVAPFTGANREFGRQLTLGIETAFNAVNDAGGIGAHRLKLITADDGYEPARTPDIVKRLAERDGVVGFIANFGTPTAAAVLPWVLDHKLLFLGAFTGSSLHRSVPPDRYVFNYRPSYAEETEAAVRYLVNVRGLKPREIVVFAQDDPFGEAGYAGVAKALRTIQGRYDEPPLKLTYKRNTIDVAEAVAALRARKVRPKAVVMAALYRPATEFIKLTRPLVPGLIYTNVSAVGATAFADELVLAGPQVADGVIVTQVVPAVNGYSKNSLEFKAALARYFPGEQPDYVAFESYVVAKILIEGIRRVAAVPGRPIDGDRLADALEGTGDLDIGLGTILKLGPAEHQASHMVWGTQLDAAGKYKAIDLQ